MNLIYDKDILYTIYFFSFKVQGNLVAARVATLHHHQADCPEKGLTLKNGIAYFPWFRKDVSPYRPKKVFTLHRPMKGVTLQFLEIMLLAP